MPDPKPDPTPDSKILSTPPELNAQIFRSHLHSRFQTESGGASISLELIEVEEPPTAPRLELFFVHFLGPAAPRLEQRIHRLQHDSLGTLDLFITAIGANDRGLIYEAVFNRLRKPPAEGAAPRPQ
jgi:hypothetical protein